MIRSTWSPPQHQILLCLTLVELGRTRVYPRENLDAYVKCFHEGPVDCYNLIAEEVLVEVRLHGMIKDYFVHFESLYFASFLLLMKTARKTK